MVKQINVPGFRKGKVPRPIFEQRFRVRSIISRCYRQFLPDAYGEAIDETDIKPVAQPEVSVTKIKKVKITFEATVTVEPKLN
ncbi:trigger factor [Staphylococcus aureus]